MFRLLCVLLCLWSQCCVADDLLVFGSDWCPACRDMKAALEKEPDMVAGYDSVRHVDFQAERPLARKYQVSVIPTLVVMKKNGKIRKKVGFNGAADLRKWLTEARSADVYSR